MKKVEGHPSLIRTPQGAIMNVNDTAFTKALMKQKLDSDRQRQINRLEERIQRLERLINA